MDQIKLIQPIHLLDFIYSACAIIHHVNMMRCFQVIVLIYSSIYISLTEWYIDSFSNKAFHSKMFLFFVTFYETPCIGYIYVLYVSIDQDISGLMMNILIMQTIRPIIAFYFIFLFMLIRHSSSNKMNTQGHPDLFFDSDQLFGII